jgi:hypothetical protein
MPVVGKDIFLRIGRHIAWRSPLLYRPVGALRRRLNYHLADYDIWVGGFPRSSNTFTGKALQVCLAGLKVVSQIHVPPPIIQAIREKKPGLFLIRHPEDAVISWAQYTGLTLEHCINYYIDFHTILLPYRYGMLIVTFEQATADIQSVIKEFARRYKLEAHSVDVQPDRLFEQIETMWTDAHGTVNEWQVARPSGVRDRSRQAYRDEIRNCGRLLSRLTLAEEAYHKFIGKRA